MSSMRRALLVIVVGGFTGTLSLLQTAATAQERGRMVDGARKGGARQQFQIQIGPGAKAPGAPGQKPSPADSFSFPTDRKAKRTLEAAEDLIKEQAWGEAAKLLQTLLETKEDVFVEVKRKDETHWTSLKGEANRLLGVMPSEGRQFYELQFGARAKAKLAQAKNESDPRLLGQVAQSYMHTDAGGEALDLLGTYHLDRGRFVQAALCFERLLKHHNAGKLTPLTLLKAHLAFRGNGDTALADQTWRQIVKAGRAGIRVGDQVVQLEQLERELGRFRAGEGPASLYEWPLFKGNASRSAQGTGSAPFLEPKWVYPLAEEKRTEQYIEDAVKRQETMRQPVLPAFFPIAVTVHTDKETKPLLIYRSYGGIRARNLNKEGKLEWDTNFNWSYDNIFKENNAHMLQLLNSQNQWIPMYQSSNPQLLYENSTVGTMSTDNKRVYAVDDIYLPPHPDSQPMKNLMWNPNGQRGLLGSLEPVLSHNRLQAFDLQADGKLVWDLGGTKEPSELHDCYFLGPPLPVGDKLYVLIEKNAEFRLVCLEPKEGLQPPAIVWMQTLMPNTKGAKMLFDVRRRLQAAHLAYGEGILVCPTNAGGIIAVDLLSQSLAWAHWYHEDAPDNGQPDDKGAMLRPGMFMPNGNQRLANLAFDWKTSAPVIQDGKVVFTAHDAHSVQCLNLRSGDLLWKQPRSDDLYLAGVYNGKVLLVGKSTCRALRLADGHEEWKIETGLPSGQGVASGNVYYLPLKIGAKTKEPEVLSFTIDKGEIQAHTRSRKKEVPGNLLFYEGDVVSQTATQIVAYRQLRIKREETEVALKKNPKDPVGLTDRGELKLDEGDLSGAVEDLRAALANTPPSQALPRTRGKLFEALTELLQDKFDASERYLDEYKELCKVTIPEGAAPAERQQLEEEQQRRQGDYLYLVAEGRKKQGRLAEAFDAYVEFGALTSNRDLVSVIGQPTIKARPDVWSQGRIAAMVAGATPEQRKPLEEKLALEWRKVQEAKDAAALRRFVAVFGSLFTVGKEARLRLAERLITDKAFLEAELHLLQLRHQEDPALAARAVDALARLMTQQGLMEDAAYWYRILGRDYARVPVRDGKTGADLFNELAADKRLLAYLDEPRQAWASGKMLFKEVSGFNAHQSTNFVYEPKGNVPPFFNRHRFASQGGALKMFDRATNQEKKTLDISRGPVPNVSQNPYGNGTQLHLPYHTLGHLMIVNTGTTVYGIDPLGGSNHPLWERSLYGPGVNAQNSQLTQNADGSLQLLYNNGLIQRLGRLGPVEASYVCLITREGLAALDPLRGTVLWTKTDVTPKTHAFGDDKYIYLVEVQSDGTTGAGKALRARDGVAVDVPDFGPLYARRLRVVGRNLLLSEKTKSALKIRFHDVHTGKDLWTRSFAADAIVLQSEDVNLLGVAEPSKQGQITVIDLPTHKEILNVRLDDPKDLDKAQAVHLLSDADRFYVAIQRAPEQNLNMWGGPFPNVPNGMRCVAVNGQLYAFNRDTGKRDWRLVSEIHNQLLVLDQFRDLPILVFTARSNEPNMGNFNRGGNYTGTQTVDKRTGKFVYEKKVPNQNSGFHAIVTNTAAGTVELIGYNTKIIHYLETNLPRDPAAKK